MFVDVWKVLKAMDETAQVKSDKASGSDSFLAKSSYYQVILIIFLPFFFLSCCTRLFTTLRSKRVLPGRCWTSSMRLQPWLRRWRIQLHRFVWQDITWKHEDFTWYLKNASREKEIRSISTSTINEVTAKKPGWLVYVEVTLYLALLSRAHGRVYNRLSVARHSCFASLLSQLLSSLGIR